MADNEEKREDEEMSQETSQESEAEEASQEEEEEVPQGEETPQGEEETTQTEEEGKRKSRLQRRIDELTWARREAERQAEYWRKIAQERLLEAKKEEPAKKPSRSDFEYEEDFQEALIAWKVQQELAQLRQEEAREKERLAQQQREQKFLENVRIMNQKGMQSFEDYEDVVLRQRNLHITDSMAHFMSEMENGHIVAYHLGHNPEKAAEIAQQTPYKQALELAKLEMQLTSKPTKKTTNLPPPTESVKGTGETGLAEPKDIEAWMKWREEQIKKRKKLI